MVAIICPYCGAGMDGTPDTDDIAQWYATNHPHLPVHSIVPQTCSDCARSYSVDDTVVLASDPTAITHIVIGLIASPNQPDLVTVRHPDGPERTYAKSQIRPHENNGVASPTPGKRDGYF